MRRATGGCCLLSETFMTGAESIYLSECVINIGKPAV